MVHAWGMILGGLEYSKVRQHNIDIAFFKKKFWGVVRNSRQFSAPYSPKIHGLFSHGEISAPFMTHPKENIGVYWG